jgi:hypothetical protein
MGFLLYACMQVCDVRYGRHNAGLCILLLARGLPPTAGVDR